MSKIKVEEILKQHTDLEENNLSFAQMELVKTAIKEIVEAVVDKCAENAEVGCHNADFDGGPYIKKESILKIKEKVEYE